jgi:cell volume regulation protein A
VFSVLRSKKLNLKNGLAPLLEAESGSNDPFSYMLTIIALSLMDGDGAGFVWELILEQLAFGVIFGVVVGIGTVFVAKRFTASTEGFECILFIAAALMAYGLPSVLNGNGYLSVYIAGIIIGNAKIPRKSETVVFLNGVTGLCQIAVFFLLGLLCTPSQFGKSIMYAVPIFLCLTVLSRPLAVAIFGGKSPIKDRAFVAFAGLRGASSIVFAIMANVSGSETEHNVFNIVFCVCLMSMLIQGTLLPAAAKKLDLIDDSADVLKTFNDYKEDDSMTMMRMFVPEGHPWENKKLSEVTLPTGSLAVMIKREGETIIPRGNTVILAKDSVILSVPQFETDKSLKLREIQIRGSHPWLGCRIRELNLPDTLLIVMVKRNGESLIPSGATEIRGGDIVVVTDTEEPARETAAT